MKQKEQENKVFIAMNKAFVKVHLPSKNGERTYNRAILPNGTKIDGAERGGFVFYPLYVNQAASNPNLYRMPFLKDRKVQLHRGEEMVEVTPEALRDALNARHQQYLKERAQNQMTSVSSEAEQERRPASEPEFDWQGTSFAAYIRSYTMEKLEEIDSEPPLSCFGSEVPEKLTEFDRSIGSISSNPVESNQFIAAHFEEAKKTHDWLKEREQLPVPDINPFDDPEAFHLAMVQRGLEECLRESEFLKAHQDEHLTLDSTTLQTLRKELETMEPKRMRQATRQNEQEMELP